MKRSVRLVNSVVLFGLLVLVTASSSIASEGNSASAHLCQQDGWAGLVRSSDASSFTNAGDCVSYGARSGTYSQLQVQARCAFGPSDFCVSISGFGLLPGSTLTTFVDLGPLGFGSYFEVVPADGAIPLHSTVEVACDGAAPLTFRFYAYAVGTTSGGATVTSPPLSGEVSICG